jgi:GNAT superfamily N-acetyltransferase
MTEAITLRSVSPADETFLCEVYSSTRTEELAPVPWSDEQKTAFLRMQFVAQHQYYQEHYPTAAFDVILVAGQPAGRLYVHRGADEVRIVDIAMLPLWRNRGVGTRLIGALQTEAALARKPLRIHVERLNPALSLYERMGFHEIEDRGVYLFLEWRATE